MAMAEGIKKEPSPIRLRMESVPHTYILSGFDNPVTFRAQPYLSFALQKMLL
jgi:hypothetical protein